MPIPAGPHTVGQQAMETNGRPVICTVAGSPGVWATDWAVLVAGGGSYVTRSAGEQVALDKISRYPSTHVFNPATELPAFDAAQHAAVAVTVLIGMDAQMFVPNEAVTGWAEVGPQSTFDGVHKVGEPGEPQFSGAWANHDDPWSKAMFWKQGGTVFITGLVVGGTNGSVIFTLPEGFRPERQEPCVQASDITPARVDVYPDGSVRAYSGGSGHLSVRCSYRAFS